jgi:adenine-specific DNA-methyltransferase
MPILNWLTRDKDIHTAARAQFRLLEELPKYSHGEGDTGNMLIQGDNLEALKALLPYYAGKVKCIFIDPPYNTRSAFEHYDDNLEHTQWLAMMYPRLEALRGLLAEDGSIWVTIDENEAHYLKVIMDEIFGRKNFIAEVIWQKRTSRENRAAIGSSHDTLLVYARMEATKWKKYRNLLAPNDKGYANPDRDPRGPWRSIPFSAQGFRPNQMYTIVSDAGIPHKPPKGRCWGATEPEFIKLRAAGRVYFPKQGKGKPRIKAYPDEDDGLVPMSLWLAADAGTTEEAKKEILALFDEDAPFGTPKPERLMRQVISVASNEQDVVLDSFLGSGTTAAVAHKMGRRYIGIEMGEHAITHCAPRLQKVIAGEQGGVSEAVGWRGGGGFRFYRLGLPVFDQNGHVSPGIRFGGLAAHLWFVSTGIPYKGRAASPLLGVYDGVAYYLLYNGILGDKNINGGNVLTGRILSALPKHLGEKVVFGEGCRLSAERLRAERISFRQIPYEIKAR